MDKRFTDCHLLESPSLAGSLEIVFKSVGKLVVAMDT